MDIERFKVRIKRQETPLARLAYRLGKRLGQTEVPAPRPLFRTLYYLQDASRSLGRFAMRAMVYQPMFRARCESCGKGLSLPLGVPFIMGDLRIRVGDNCHINGHNVFIAAKIFDAPVLSLGDHVYVGHGVEFVVARRITLGSHVLVAENCVIMDTPGHPLDPVRRRRDEPVDRDQVRPVTIEDDVWIGMRAIILPGATIGRGSVIGAGSVVSGEIPPLSLAVGNPARVVRSIRESDREEIAAGLGDRLSSTAGDG